MDNTIDTPKKKRGAPVGHGRYGGRAPGSLSRTTWDLLQKSEQLGADPLAVHLQVIAADGCLKLPVIDSTTGLQKIDEWGECLFQWVAVSLTERIAACRAVMGYLYPKLQSTRISGPNHGPVEVAALDITQLLNDPALARQAQVLALQIAEQQNDQNAPQLPRPYDHCQPKE